MGIHFSLSMMIPAVCMPLLAMILGEQELVHDNGSYRYVIEMTGIAGVVTMLPCILLYRTDRLRREFGRLVPVPSGHRMRVGGAVLLLLMGAALSLYGNLLMSMISSYIRLEDYSAEMELIERGKALPVMTLWLGIAAPIAEEMVFRWLIYLRLRDHIAVLPAILCSSLMFGIYHGNLPQMVYASLLGAAFALSLELTGNLWSSILVHVGANVFSLLLEEMTKHTGNMSDFLISVIYLTMFTVFLLILAGGFLWEAKRGRQRGYRAL